MTPDEQAINAEHVRRLGADLTALRHERDDFERLARVLVQDHMRRAHPHQVRRAARSLGLTLRQDLLGAGLSRRDPRDVRIMRVVLGAMASWLWDVPQTVPAERIEADAEDVLAELADGLGVTPDHLLECLVAAERDRFLYGPSSRA
jgi:hypothetical protein